MTPVAPSSPLRRSSTSKMAAIAGGALILAGTTASSSPLAMLAVGIVAILLVLLFWRPGSKAILLVPLSYQWAQITVKPLRTALNGVSLNDLSDYGFDLEPAVLLAASSLAALAIGVHFGLGRDRVASPIMCNAATWPFRRILIMSLVALVAGHTLDNLQGFAGSARSIVVTLGGLKWVGLFLIAYWALAQRKRIIWLGAVVTIEILLGMTGYFAEFRIVFLVLIAAILAVGRSMQRSEFALIAITVAATVALGVFWSAVKGEYRAYMNLGTGAQVVFQPLDERILYLANEATNFDTSDFAYGFDGLLSRLSYIDYLAATINNVPENIPYQNGVQIGGALRHILMPRVLFPDKPPTPNDTKVTAYYTGLPISASSNVAFTSISIGYVGELYIDFGSIGAVAISFLMGLAFGRGFRAIRDFRGLPQLLNLGFCIMVALPLAGVESALIKLIGAIVMTFAVAMVIQRFVAPLVLTQLFRR